MHAVAPAEIEFRAEDHTYWLNGELVPNVTRVLQLITDYSHIDPYVLLRAQQEGVDMHRTVELHVKHDLDEERLPEWLVPRLAAFRKFEAETGFRMLASEQRVYHPISRYAGTLDLVGKMRLPGRTQDAVVIVDLKRTLYPGNRAVGLQLAAYTEAWNAAGNVPRITHRFALQLRPDGEYRLRAFINASDKNYFMACLLVHRIKEQMQ